MNQKILYKVLATLSAILLILSLSACKENNGKNPENPSTGGDPQEEQPLDQDPSKEDPDKIRTGIPTVEEFDPEATYGAVDFLSLAIGDYVTLGRYRNMTVTIKQSQITVTDEQVEQVIASELQEKHPGAKITDRSVAWGDSILLSYIGTVNGEAFSGGSAENQLVTVDEETAVGYIPGFVEGLVGLMPGVATDVPVTFPENYHASELAGKDAVFTMTVSYIVGHPELTDDFASVLTDGKCVTAAAYREQIRGELEEEAYDMARYVAIWTRIFEISAVKTYPVDDVMQRYGQYYSSYSSYAAVYGMEYDDFLTAVGVTKTQLFNECLSLVKQQLIRYAVYADLGLTCDEGTYEEILTAYTDKNYDSLREQLQSMGYELTKEECRQYMDAYYRADVIQSYLEEQAYAELLRGITVIVTEETTS